MKVQTTRWGEVECAEEAVITFQRGLLGFPQRKQWVMFSPSEVSEFFWLQAIDAPELALVVTDPTLFEDFAVHLRPEQAEQIGLSNPDDAQILVVVNAVDGMLTGNLQGPLVINCTARLGGQFIVESDQWTTRHPLRPMTQKEHGKAKR